MAAQPGLSIINPTPTRQNSPRCLHHLISPPSSSQALEHVEYRSRVSYTYAELHRVSDAIADLLQQLTGNLERQLVVPVLIEQSPILYASLLGILKAGAAFCPLNIDAPPERVSFILNDVRAPLVLVSPDLETKIPKSTGAKSVIVDWEELSDAGLRARASKTPSEGGLAYVMYTSGSTGTPKGVAISHSAVTQAFLAHEKHIPAFARFLQFAAPTFDVSVFEIFFPLVRGSTLVSARRSELLDDLPRIIRDLQIDACELTPTVAGGLLKSRKSVPNLKLLLTIGEMLTEPVIREFGGQDGTASILWAMYGPTEATIHCTLQPAMSASSSVKNIGSPLETVSCFIARAADPGQDFRFEVLARGESGELVVGGHQLADGYLNRPEQNEASFIETQYGRLYRTGDKARMLEDGTLECLGRLAEGQVKLRGQRLELGEVQEAILRTPGCHNAVSLVHDSSLIAFCESDPDVLEDAILDQCRQWLPSFMVPTELILVTALPKLPSGKVDKRKLLGDFEESRENSLRQDSPGNEHIPEKLAETVKKVLSRDVQPNTPLSSIGLDSLSAIQISSALRFEGYHVDVSTLLQTQTLLSLWQSIENNEAVRRPGIDTRGLSMLPALDDLVAHVPSLRELQDQVEDIISCTPLQTSMLAETFQHSECYWNHVEIGTTFSSVSLIPVLRQLFERNEIFRAGFAPHRDGFFSIIFSSSVRPKIRQVQAFVGGSRDLLEPLQVQVRTNEDGEGTRLLFTIHHALYDGWAFDLFLYDLLESLKGHQPESRPQFRAVTAYSQQQSLGWDEAHVAAKAFWAEHLLGWAKEPFPTFVGRFQTLNRSAITTGRIEASLDDVQLAASKFGGSVQAIFQASLALVWSGLVASEDLVIGSVTSGRTLPIAGIESIIGPCIASLPLRLDMSRFADTQQLLNHIHSVNRAMMGHTTLPLSEIRKVTEVQAGNSLYDVLFAYQKSPQSKVRRGTELWEVRHHDQLETKVVIEVEPVNVGFDIQVTYHTDALGADMANMLISQLQEVFYTILNDQNSALGSIKRSIGAGPSVFNPDPEVFQGTPDLAKIFEATVSLHPDRKAICFAEPGSDRNLKMKTITYSQLNRLANKIAHFLLSGGLGTRQVIGLVMEKSILLYASILAIVKIGCAYLPVLPTTPVDRMRIIFKQAKTRHCLVDLASFDALSALRGLRLLEVESAPLSNFKDYNLDIAPDGSRLAYVIYTSGTTGEPKGVAVTQLNIASNIGHLRDTYPISPSTTPRLLQACSQAFDVSVFEIFYAWHAGMCLCSGTNDTLFADLEHAIRELDVTHLSLTPTVAGLIDPSKVPKVEFLVTAGEPLTHTVLEAWGDRLWQGYGPSETTNICSVKRMQRGLPIEHLGWTFPNTSVFVMHFSHLEPVPVGWVGEFCYGGDQVVQGYLNMPKLTAEQFVHHPTFGRIYRSGDIGRMLPDGSLVIIGRLDGQLKLRGQRIEADEINAALTSSGQVKSSTVVIGERSGGSSKQLVAFYVPAEPTSGCGVLDIDPSINRLLFSTLQSRLPAYMVPSHLIPIGRIPLTSSGKLHHRHLLQLFKDLPSTYLGEASAIELADHAQDHEWSHLESVIAGVISSQTALEVSEIKRWTPFAALGIDSISAIGITRSLTDHLERSVPVSALMRHTSVAQLARYIETEASIASPSNNPTTIRPACAEEARAKFPSHQIVEDVLPCTPLQEAMLSVSSRGYYNKIMLRLNKSAQDMKSYWEEMIGRHQILRTCFVTTKDVNRPVVQVVLQNSDIAWVNLVATKPSFDDIVQEHMALVPDPVDSTSPPISFAAIQYRGSLFLSLICHHALYDGVAMENLWREVETLANGLSLPPPVPYGPFLYKMLDLPQDVESFWKGKVHGLQYPRVFSSSKKIDQASTTKSLRRSLSATHHQLRSLGTSMLSLYQSAWSNTLALTYNTSDVCFGNVFSGRSVDVEGVDHLAAPTFNTVPIRTDLSKRSHGHDLLKTMQKLNADLLPYQFTPLRLVQKVANRSGQGLFESLFILQQPLHEMDDSVWILEGDSGDMDVPVVCEVVPCPSLNTVVVNLHYDANIVDSNVAIALVEIFDFVADFLLESPYAILPQRTNMPPELRDAIQTLRPQREKDNKVDRINGSDHTWTETQRDIRQVFSELSGRSLPMVSLRTTIFQLGLDSINAVQLAAMLRSKGYVVSVSDVAACPTCERLADQIQKVDSKAEGQDRAYNLQEFAISVAEQWKSVLPPDMDPEAVLPCTPMQCAMLQKCLESDGNQYLNTMEFEFSNETETDRVVHAWRSLVRLHPLLRTGFVRVNHPDTTFAMVRHAVSSARPSIIRCKAEDVDSQVDEARKVFTRQLYAPAWRVILDDSSERLRMILCIHHAIYDADSLSKTISALSGLLQGAVITPFPPVETGLEHVMSRSLNNLEAAERHWKAKAASAVVNSFPVMTPLREKPAPLLTESIVSSMSTSALHHAASEADLSLQAIIQASWTRILSAYLGEGNVVFGVSLSGRIDKATLDTPLPCLTTVPVVASYAESNDELLRYMMNYTVGMHEFQYAPLSQVQKWLGHPASPVFDTIVSYRRLSHDFASDQPFQLTRDDPVVDYPVSVEVETCTANEQVKISTTFKPDVLPVEQSKILLQQFDAVMCHLALHPTGSASDLHRHITPLLSELPPKMPDMHPPVKYLHQFVEERAKSEPGKIALEFVQSFDQQPQRWTYGKLDELGNRVANMLSSFVPVNSIVAVHFDKCSEAYFSILGILKAGCAFVALDVTAPMARKSFILEDSTAACVLTASLTGLDWASNTNAIAISEDILQNYSAAPLKMHDAFTPESTCYCLYTSGTTGTPKGCEITHDNVVHAMMAFQDLFSGHWDDNSRWLQFAALHFDVSVLEQYWSWSVGITVVAAPKDFILDDLSGTINKLGITHIDLTPSLARLTHPDEVPSLCRGVFITGGESLKQEILDAWGPKAVIYNAYGPTEATIGVTMYQRVPINGRPSNIGKQFPNVGSYVFKPGTEIPLLRGSVGELCVSGKLVGKGYLNRPDLTEERFPTLKDGADRVYRTGDLVRLLHDGSFDFLGRADDQVKLRGQRLEIGEINHVIRGVPGVHDAAVIVGSQGSDDKSMLVAFLVSEGTSRDQDLAVLEDKAELGTRVRGACRNHLPAYMVPTYYLLLPFIPLSVNNKAEIKQLRKLFADLSHEELMRLTASSNKSFTANNPDILGRITRTLGSFSDTSSETIGVDANIFELGVDSISALRLSALLKKEGFAAATPALVLRNPVVGDLAQALAQTSSSSYDGMVKRAEHAIRACGHRYRALVGRELDLMPGDIEYIAPCSSLQEGMLSKAMGIEGTGFYFNHFDLTLRQGVDPEALRVAWEQLIESQPILRTQFVSTPTGFVQVAKKGGRPRWKSMKLQNMSLEAELESHRRSWLNDNKVIVKHPLDLLLIEDGAHLLLRVHIFHAIYDGTSFDLMLSQVSTLLRHKTSPLGPSLLQAFTHGPLLNHDSSRHFWAEQLRDWRRSSMRTLCANPSSQPTTGLRLLSGELIDGIQQSLNVTLQSVVLALWVSVLQRKCSSCLTVGVIVSGRSIDLPGVEKTIGPLFNTLPFFSETLAGRSWSALIQQCHDFGTSTAASQHVSLQKIQKWCSQGQPLFDTLFALQVESPSVDAGKDLWDTSDGEPNPDYPLAFEMTRTQEEQMTARLVAQGHIADQRALEEMFDQLEEHLRLMSDDVHSAIPCESPGEAMPANLSAPQTLRVEQDVNFTWDAVSSIIREEVASLAGIQLAEVSPATKMLHLGLDSIDLIKLSAKLKARGINLPASKIMQIQTIALMATESDSGSTGSAIRESAVHDVTSKLEESLLKRRPNLSGAAEILPATPLQESMVAAMVESEFEWYFNHDILQIRDDVHLDQLKAAWNEVVAAYPILRTGFCPVEDPGVDLAYCQIILQERQIWHDPIQANTLEELDDVMTEAKSIARRAEAASDLFQLRIAQVGSQHFLIVSIAHALYDGWSLALVYRKLERALKGSKLICVSTAPFLKDILTRNTPDMKHFWSDYLQDCPQTLLPQRARQDPVTVKRERTSAAPMSDIQSFCRQVSISLQTLCQACWAVVLSRLTGQLDVAFGVVMSGRDFDGSEDLVFPTMNTVAFRCVIHGTASEFLKYLEENMMGMRQNHNYPLRKALAASKAPSGGLFNTLFLLQKLQANPSSDTPVLTSVRGSSAMDYPVCVEAEVVGASLQWRTACQTDHIPQEDVLGLLNTLDQAMQFMIGSADSEIVAFGEEDVALCGLPPNKLVASKRSRAVEHSIKDGQTEKTNIIKEVLSQVSGVPESDIQLASNLYHLGLDSISAIKVASRLRQEGIDVTTRDVVRADNIRHLISIARDTKAPSKVSIQQPPQWTAPPALDLDSLLRRHHLASAEIAAILPALPMQVYMLGVWQNSRRTVFYPEFTYILRSRCHEDDIHAAWGQVVQRTPILRTRFIATGLQELPVVQAILKSTPSPQLVDFQAKWEEERGAWVLHLRLHHALYDGVSLPAIVRDLGDTISRQQGDTSTSQAAALAQWTRYTTNPTLGSKRSGRQRFWTRYLNGCPRHLPDSEPRTGYPIERVSYIERSAVLKTAGLRRTAAKDGLSVQSLFLAAYAQTLSRRESDLQGAVTRDDPHEDVVFGIYYGNRSGEDQDKLPMTFPRLNLVPLRVDAAGGLVDVASRIQKNLGEIASDGRADVGLWEIAEWTGVQITSFVNFLTLPEREEEPEDSVVEAVEGVAAPQSVGDARETDDIGDVAVRDVFPVSHNPQTQSSPSR